MGGSSEIVLVDNADHYIHARLADDNLYIILEDLRDPEQTWKDNLLVFIDKNQNNSVDDHVDMIWNRKLFNTGIFSSSDNLHTYYIKKYSGLGEQRQEMFTASDRLNKPHLIYTLKMPLWAFVEGSKQKIHLAFVLTRDVPEDYEFDKRTLEPTGLKTTEYIYPEQPKTNTSMINSFILDFSKSTHTSIQSLKSKNVDRLFSSKPGIQQPPFTPISGEATVQENLKFITSPEYDGVYIQKKSTAFAKLSGVLKHHVEYGHIRSGNSSMADIIFAFTRQRTATLQKIVITGEEYTSDEIRGIRAYKLLFANDETNNYFVKENGGVTKGIFYKLGEEVAISKSRNNNQYEIIFQDFFTTGKDYVLVVGNTWYPFVVVKNLPIVSAEAGNSYSSAQSVQVNFSHGKGKMLQTVKARIGAFGRVRSDGSGYDKVNSGIYYYMPEWFTDEKCARIKKDALESIRFKGLFDYKKLKLVRLQKEELHPDKLYINRAEGINSIDTDVAKTMIYYRDLFTEIYRLDKKKTIDSNTTLFSLKDLTLNPGFYAFCFDADAYVILIE